MRPVNRIKHVVDLSGGLSSTSAAPSFAATVDAPSAVFNPSEVNLGSTINAFFLSYFVIGDTGAPVSGPVDWYIAKARAGQNTVADFPDPGETGVSNVRNQIIHEEKGLPGSGDGTPMVFKGVIAIPKGMRRFRSGDVLFIKQKANSTDTPNFCAKFIYNEFR